MCGIVGYVGKNKNALHVLIDGLTVLEYRGYDSAGIAFLNSQDRIEVIRKEGKIENLEKKLDFKIKSRIGIGHTRWATHGIPSVTNCHPHQVGNITLVHNGIIENYEQLKKELVEKGYQFQSDTDTEVAAATIDDCYQTSKNMLEALKAAQKKLKGSYAFGIICSAETDTLYAMRKDSPLIVAVGKDEFYIASDVPAVLKYTKQYTLLEEGEIAELKEDQLTIYDEKLHAINYKIEEFKNDYECSLKNGYDSYMLKEIFEQPKVIKDTIRPFLEKGHRSLVEKMPDFSSYERIDIVACGSAYHTGLIGKYLIEKYASIPVTVEIASEYRYKKLFLDAKTLVILISQSGETADTLAALRIAKQHGSHTLGIVNVVGSSVAREADEVLYSKAGCEIAVATTKAYSSQVAMLSLIALTMAITRKEMTTKMVDSILKEFEMVPSYLEKILKDANKYYEISKKLYKQESIFFLGRGIDYALAMEGSLKLKEISYIHSEAYAAGELKHGTISLIEKNTPVIAIITDEDIAEKTMSNIKEVKARGANVTLLTNQKQELNSNCYDQKITIPKTNELIQPLLTIIPLQLIAYGTAKLKKCDVDKPRNLAKSVTVE